MPAFFNTTRNGYNQEEVDNYIRNLEKNINEYRDKDAAIANALVNAQIAADNIIKNADLAAKSIKQEAVDQLDRIADSLENQRRLIADFKKDYDELVEKYLYKAKQSDFDEVLNRVEELDAYLHKLRNNTPDAPEQSASAFAPAPAPVFAPAQAPVSTAHASASAPLTAPTQTFAPAPEQAAQTLGFAANTYDTNTKPFSEED